MLYIDGGDEVFKPDVSADRDKSSTTNGYSMISQQSRRILN